MQYAAITARIAHVNLLGGGCNGPIVAVFDLSLDDQELFSSEGVAGLYVAVFDLGLDNQQFFSGEGVADDRTYRRYILAERKPPPTSTLSSAWISPPTLSSVGGSAGPFTAGAAGFRANTLDVQVLS